MYNNSSGPIMVISGETAKVILKKAESPKGNHIQTVKKAKEKMINMCKAWEDQKEIGKSIGKELGLAKGIIEMGEDYGIPEDEIMLKLQEKMDISSDKATEYMELLFTQHLNTMLFRCV